MSISIIVARGRKGEIGRKNGLPWNLPNDLKRFQNITKNHTVVMGQNTYESIKGMIGGHLPNRNNVIATLDPNFKTSECEVTLSLLDYLKEARGKNEEIFVIGGASIYKQALPYADKLYITEVDTEVSNADAFFPETTEKDWRITAEEKHDVDEKHAFPYNFRIYERSK